MARSEFVLISNLKICDELQARDSLPAVEEYAEVIKPCKAKSWPPDMPPVKVIAINSNEGPQGPGLYLTDGFMRTGACQMLRRRYVKARIKTGSWMDARAESQGANMEHGYRLSSQEIARNVKRAVADGCSIAEVARRCKISRQTVYNYLDKMTEDSGRKRKSKRKPKPSQEAQAKEIEKQGEAETEGDPCKRCRCRIYVDTPSGLCCKECGAQEGAEPESDPIPESEMRRESVAELQKLAAEPYKRAESARGKLIRELDEIDLLEPLRSHLKDIYDAIDKAKREAIKNAAQP